MCLIVGGMKDSEVQIFGRVRDCGDGLIDAMAREDSPMPA